VGALRLAEDDRCLGADLNWRCSTNCLPTVCTRNNKMLSPLNKTYVKFKQKYSYYIRTIYYYIVYNLPWVNFRGEISAIYKTTQQVISGTLMTGNESSTFTFFPTITVCCRWSSFEFAIM